MAQDGNLPFDRGDTFKGGFTASTAVPHVALQIAGNSYQTNDDATNGHSTGQVVELMPIVNRAGAALTLTRSGLRASTLNSHTPFDSVNVAGGPGVAALTMGGHGFIPDDRYSSGASIPAGDIFYAVKRGPALARVSTRGGTIAVGAHLCFTTGGTLRPISTFAGQRIVQAIAMQAATTANVQKLVNVVPN